MAEQDGRRKKQVFGIAAGVLLVYWLVFHVFVSDETRIRRVLQNSADGFNDTHKSRCISALAEDFRDETMGLNRDMIGQGLVYLFLKEKHPDMDAFRFRIELVEDKLEIEVADVSPPTAKVSVLLRFSKQVKSEFAPVWDVEIDGGMEKTSAGWKVKRSRYRGVSGKSPF